MHRASRLLASDLDGTLIAAHPSPDDVAGVAEFGAATAARALPTAYITGRHFALALEGIAAAGLPRPDMLASDVGTRIFRDDGNGGWRPDGAFHEEMRRRLGGVVLDDVHALLAPHAFLRKQPEAHQSDLKLSYEVPDGRDGRLDDAARIVRETMQAAGLRLQVVASLDPVTGHGLIDVLPEGAGKHTTLAFLERALGLASTSMVFAGDSGNDREALSGPWLGVLVGNAPRELAGALHGEAIRTGRADRLYLASAPCVRGVLEGCRHFSFL